jgi:hypothetical protein
MPALAIEVMNKPWPQGDSKIPDLRPAIIDHAPAVVAKIAVGVMRFSSSPSVTVLRGTPVASGD